MEKPKQIPLDSASKEPHTMKSTKRSPIKFRRVGNRRVQVGVQLACSQDSEPQECPRVVAARKLLAAKRTTKQVRTYSRREKVATPTQNSEESTTIGSYHSRSDMDGLDTVHKGNATNPSIVDSLNNHTGDVQQNPEANATIGPHADGMSAPAENMPEGILSTPQDDVSMRPEVQPSPNMSSHYESLNEHNNECNVDHHHGPSEVPPSAHDASTKVRKVRGRTKMKTKGRREPGDPLIKLEFDNEGKVSSANATTFANFCGVKVRKYAPLQVRTWQDVPDKPLQKIFRKIKKHYDIPHDPKVLHQILKSMEKKYRAYRTQLKSRYFDVHKTTEARLSNRPKGMKEEDWTYLVTLFSSEEFQLVSNRNRNNRMKKPHYHSAGTSSFAKVGGMMKEKDGVSPRKYQVYEKTHTDANGDPIDGHSRDIMEKVQQFVKDKGVDVDTAFHTILPAKKKLKVPRVLESTGGDMAEDMVTLNASMQQAKDRADFAERMALKSQQDAAAAIERARILEIKLAKAQLQSLTAARGEAAQATALAEAHILLAEVFKTKANAEYTGGSAKGKEKVASSAGYGCIGGSVKGKKTVATSHGHGRVQGLGNDSSTHGSTTEDSDSDGTTIPNTAKK